MASFSKALPEFRALNAQVVGVSVDSPFVHAAWKKQAGLSLKLLSDFNRTMLPAYRAFFDTLADFKGVPKRAVYVVAMDGSVAYSWVSQDPGVLPDPVESLAVVKRLSTTKPDEGKAPSP